jgi:hypothetical protein
MKSLRQILWAFGTLTPSPLLACATCSAHSDSPLAHGMNAGIFTLLGVLLTLLTGFALFFVHVMRNGQTPPDDSTLNSKPQNSSEV